MRSIIKKILIVGQSEDNPDYLNEKIKISNVIALLMTILVLFFALLQLVEKENALFHFIAIAVLTAILVINYLKAYTLSRVLTILVPMALLNYMKYINLIKSGSDREANILLTLGLLLLGFILFDPYEKIKLYAVTAVISLITLLAPTLIIEVLIPDDKEVYPPNFVSNLIAVTFIYLSLIVLVNGISRSRKKSETLLTQINTKNESLKASEEELNKRLTQLDEAQRLEKQNNWISQGLNELGQLLRENEDKENLYDLILSKLVKYLEVNQGSFFVLESDDDDKECLVLAGLYAYERKKFEDKKIAIGQGLVGQCYLEKEPILITDVPDDYIRITSGVGEATPNFVCLMPMIAQDKVEGIIELASFQEMEEYKILFLERFGEIMASQIRNIRSTRMTKMLLEEANQQKEELSTQAEEFRQNLEEMEAIQETLERKNAEYESVQEENQLLEKKVIEQERKLKELKAIP